MIAQLSKAIRQRTVLGLLIAGTALSSCAAQAATYTMFRDAGCGCCLAWADHVRQNGAQTVEVIEHPDMAAVKAEHGVPAELQSCHTMIADGYVIEGHVPAADIARLLRERPAGVTGLAVAGMPIGSPGMEQGSRREAYQVIAFGPGGTRVFASHE